MSKEIIAAQYRAEELLLDLIYDRVLVEAPLNPNKLDEPASDRYKGYHEGWWECIEQLRIVCSSHTEDNIVRLERYTR